MLAHNALTHSLTHARIAWCFQTRVCDSRYTCFVDTECRQCLASLYAPDAANGAVADALRDGACRNVTGGLLNNVMGYCEGFPTCTFYKQQCAALPGCAACLSMLVSGDGAEAARMCPYWRYDDDYGSNADDDRTAAEESSTAIKRVVSSCFDGNSVSCDFWRQRCMETAHCGQCVAALADVNGNDARAIAAVWLTNPSCVQAGDDVFGGESVNAVTSGCPGVSACQSIVTNCIINQGDVCITCINGTAQGEQQLATCAAIAGQYAFDAACQPCPASVHTINVVVFATAAVGGASAVACLAVATTVVAHRRDRAMRDRIVIGLMLTNAVYSTANAIPLNALRTDFVDCGRLAMSFNAIRFGRAWWFCGKYGLVCFELLILGVSIRAMHRGTTVLQPRTEVVLHVTCFVVAALAFAVFFALCANANADGYNSSAEAEAYTNSFVYASATDDLNDDEPSAAASVKFQNGRTQYDSLVRDMLVVWDVLVGLAAALWAVLRMVHRSAARALRTEAVASAQAQAADVWADTRQSTWNARRRLLEASGEAFNEVAKPLEPYIFVFVVFAAPAFVMSTSFCQSRSGASASDMGTTSGRDGAAGGSLGTSGDNGDATDFKYGTCDVWCEFVLAFRSLGTVAVYLLSRERRAELVCVHATWRKLRQRLVGCFRNAAVPHVLLPDHEQRNAYELAAWEMADASHASWHISECDISKERLLGKGAFGEVWQSVLQPGNRRVAVKILLLVGAVDDDGDLVDPQAEEDLRKECAALQRVDSPYLIKFYGFGTSQDGRGFIVTELMAGGSLEDALHDRNRELPWRKRVAVGLQVALGMEHLHQRLMLHRDLKSANVLLDEQKNNAKVCDFGLSRVVRPPARRHHLVRSAFTGVERWLPRVDGVDEMNGDGSFRASSNIALSFLDVRGTMTKAAGTMLWMAPEVFRGDQDYTRAVDVYSFGIVLWELATRQVPWSGELPSDPTTLFEGLNHALQTGQRPTVPDALLQNHGPFVAVMKQCWAGDAVVRPAFADAAMALAEILRGYSAQQALVPPSY
jgi:hypothetical protein